YGALGVLDERRQRLAEFITVGIADDQHRRIGTLPEGHGILGTLIADPRPLRLPDLRAHPDSYGFPPHHPPMRSFLGVPVRSRDTVIGNLYLTDKCHADEFSEHDEQQVMALAGAAAVAVMNARLHAEVETLALTHDRQRIAEDLHDTVIQRLFAAGLSLQGTTRLVRSDPAAAEERIDRAVDDLDLTIRHIRSVIFGLSMRRGGDSGVRDRVLSLLREAESSLGFTPTVFFDGPIDAQVRPFLAVELLATLREALSNVARHARASQVEVSLVVTDGHASLKVVDDGIGPPVGRPVTGRGLGNMASRAERHGGRFTLEHGPPSGTVLTWSVPTGVQDG
ncbi:MAG: GAF domain-containing sensor histidine kinase, partial [Acidimicrobiia bacterium]|nr:GAF domain-containing sensor histidine kinase [Acidimicrobiia bacterium]